MEGMICSHFMYGYCKYKEHCQKAISIPYVQRTPSVKTMAVSTDTLSHASTLQGMINASLKSEE